MTHAAMPHWVDLLGLFAGTLGVCIAVWLQVITPRKARPRYVLGFLLTGTTLMLANPEPVAPVSKALIFLGAFMYILLIAGECYLAFRVWQESDIQPLADTQQYLTGGRDGGN